MSRKTTILGLAAAAVLAGSAMTASAAPNTTVTFTLKLTNASDGTPIIADGSGIYNLTPGQLFDVTINMAVTNPNLGSTARTATNVRNKPLGVGSLSTQLVTSAPLSSALGGGPVAMVVPVIDTAGSPPTQDKEASYNALITTAGANFPDTVNLVDLGADGDLDVNGTGYGINPGSPSNSTILTTYAIGTQPGGIDLITHRFIAQSVPGVANLHTNTTTINIFADPTGSGPVDAQPIVTTQGGGAVNPQFGTWSEGSVLIAVPEPASMGLLATGALALAARRRRA